MKNGLEPKRFEWITRRSQNDLQVGIKFSQYFDLFFSQNTLRDNDFSERAMLFRQKLQPFRGE